MRSIWMPDYYCEDLLEVDWNGFREMGIRLVFLDIDNTLEVHGSRRAGERSLRIFREIREAGLDFCILSNAKSERACAFCEGLDVEYLGHAAKPLTFRIRRYLKEKKIPRSACLMVGDQVFTDLLCGRFAGTKVLFCKLISPVEKPNIRFKRKLEKFLCFCGRDPSTAPLAPLKDESPCTAGHDGIKY